MWQSRRRPWFAITLGFLVSAAACAEGLGVDAPDARPGGNGADAARGTPDAAHGVVDARPGAPDAAHLLPDAMHLPPDAAGFPCASGAACSGATPLGTVSGDTGNGTLSASGAQSAWYQVRVTEDDSSVFGVPMHLQATLTSPAGANFDVFLYVNAGSDAVECATTSGTISTSGAVDTNRLEWGEGAIANGSDDGRTVSVEVRAVSGTCAPGQTWQLSLLGDW